MVHGAYAHFGLDGSSSGFGAGRSDCKGAGGGQMGKLKGSSTGTVGAADAAGGKPTPTEHTMERRQSAPTTFRRMCRDLIAIFSLIMDPVVEQPTMTAAALRTSSTYEDLPRREVVTPDIDLIVNRFGRHRHRDR